MGSIALTAGTTPTLFVQSDHDITFAYRRFGKQSDVPIVLHIHFRGNMDFCLCHCEFKLPSFFIVRYRLSEVGKGRDPESLKCGPRIIRDPLFVDTLAKEREIIIFDNAGVGRSTGIVPSTFSGWANDMISFVGALGLKQVDLLGFSMGGMAAIEAALAAPHLIRNLIIAGSKASAPSSLSTPIPGIVWPQDTPDPKYVTALASGVTLEEGRDALRYSNFPDTDHAKTAFNDYWTRLQQRSVEAPQLQVLPMDKGGNNQIAAVLEYGEPRVGASFDRLGELKMPVLVLNGDSDFLIPTSRSWELLKFVENAQLIIYPKSGHGFIWQYAERVAGDVNRFLGGLGH